MNDQLPFSVLSSDGRLLATGVFTADMVSVAEGHGKGTRVVYPAPFYSVIAWTVGGDEEKAVVDTSSAIFLVSRRVWGA